MAFEDTKKSYEIDHDWEFIGVYRPDSGSNLKTYKCKQCENHYFGEDTDDKKSLSFWPSGFRPKDSGCQILYVVERLKNCNQDLREELAEYEAVFKTINVLLDRNKHEPK